MKGLHICNTSHYFGYCQAVHEKGRYRGEQCAQMRADGDDLYCIRHRMKYGPDAAEPPTKEEP